MRSYYRQNPQLNRAKALAALQAAERILQDNPFAGTRFEDFDTVREFKIQGTAFALLYTVARDTVWVIDLRDQRGLRSADAVAEFLQNLPKPRPDEPS